MAWFAKRPKGAAQSKRVVTVSLPPPILGENTTDDPTQMDPRFAIEMYGLVPGRGGVKLRTGTKYHIDAVTNGRSLLSFHGATSSDDRLFCATNLGIYNATSAGAALPAASVSFGTTTGNAGYCSSVTMVTAAGPFLLVCDEVNGYYHYDPSGPTWTKATAGAGAGQINGVDPALLTFVTVWKNRVWFVQGGTGRAWYLPVGQYAGTVQAFDFGNKFSTGGSLVGLYSWTHDGGAGIDDHLVAVSSNGDVLIYAGTDPASAGAFNLVGSWSTGGLIASRRFACDVGGDLWLLIKRGLIPVSALVRGSLSDPRAFVSYPVQATVQAGTSYVAVHPVTEDGVILLAASGAGKAVETTTRAWSFYDLAGVTCLTTYQGVTYFVGGSTVGIQKVTGTLLDVARDGTGGTNIYGTWHTKYFGAENATRKTWSQVRARLSAAPTAVETIVYSTDPPGNWTTGAATSNAGYDGSWLGVSMSSRTASVFFWFNHSAALYVYGADIQFIPGGDQ